MEFGWDEERKLARVAVKQAQEISESAPPFALPLAIRFVVDGKDKDVTLDIEQAEETFLFPLPSKPAQAVIDPGNHLLKKLDAKKPDETWREELRCAHALVKTAMDKKGANFVDACKAAGLH